MKKGLSLSVKSGLFYSLYVLLTVRFCDIFKPGEYDDGTSLRFSADTQISVL